MDVFHLSEAVNAPKRLFSVRPLESDDVTKVTHDKMADHGILEQLKPLWILLKVTGMMPFATRPRGSPLKTIFLTALNLLYRVLLYGPVGYFICQRYRAMMAIPTLYDFVTSLLIAAISDLPFLCLPFVWLGFGRLRTLLDDWRKLEDLFFKVTGSCLQLDMRWRTAMVLVAAAIPFGCTLVLVAHHIEVVGFPVLMLTYGAIVTGALLAFWCLMCHACVKTEKLLRFHLQKSLQEPEAVSHQLIPDYQRLWLRLSALLQDIGNVWYQTYLAIMLSLLSNVLLTLYLIIQGGLKSSLGFETAFAFSTCGAWLFLFTNSAGNASDAIQNNFLKGLVEAEVKQEKIQTQLLQLRLTVAGHATTVDLGGFCVVNRSTITGILATLTTYMIVLLQFRQTKTPGQFWDISGKK